LQAATCFSFPKKLTRSYLNIAIAEQQLKSGQLRTCLCSQV